MSNDRIKNIKKLTALSKERKKQRRYVVEGIRMFEEIPEELLDGVFASESFAKENPEIIKKYGLITEINIVADNVYNTISETVTPQGIMAVVKRQDYSLQDIISGDNPFVLIMEKIQDPGNLGTIIRTAEAAGVTGVLLSRDCVDLYNPKTIRSTMGAIFRVPVCTSEDLKEDILYLKDKNIRLYAAHLDGDDFYCKDFKCAMGFLIGNEGNGLSEEIAGLADEKLRIPMEGKVESLNAAVSSAVICYEVLRQRRHFSTKIVKN